MVGAIAGVLVAPISTLDPTMMWDPLLKGFAAAVLGGLKSLPGVVIGGLLLGLIENLFGFYISLEFKSVVAFAIIIVVLFVKPSGLFDKHYVRKV
jgi:branched-chain amino acid transport system permease protein